MEKHLRQGAELMPCGHPQACVQIGEEVADGQYVHYCGWCASLEQLEHQRRLWKFSAKLHREQHLAFQEICHAQAERIIDLHSEGQRLREALDDAYSGSSELWTKALEAASHLYETWAKYGTGDGATETALEAFGQAWDEMLE